MGPLEAKSLKIGTVFKNRLNTINIMKLDVNSLKKMVLESQSSAYTHLDNVLGLNEP